MLSVVGLQSAGAERGQESRVWFFRLWGLGVWVAWIGGCFFRWGRSLWSEKMAVKVYYRATYLPVRPQMLTRWPGETFRLMFWRAPMESLPWVSKNVIYQISAAYLYSTVTASISSRPRDGQCSGGVMFSQGLSSTSVSASKSFNLAIAPKEVSSTVHPERKADRLRLKAVSIS